MKITIQPVANEGLYRDIQEGINARATHHRTISGAFDGLQKMNRHADGWARSCGQWGRIEIVVDGRKANYDDVMSVMFALDDDKRDGMGFTYSFDMFSKIVTETAGKKAA